MEPLNFHFLAILAKKGTFGTQWQSLINSRMILFKKIILILSTSIIITVIGKVNLGHNASVCDNIREFPEIQIESQKLIAAVQVGKVFPLA